MDKSNKPSLLIIIGSLDLGGAENHLLTILPRLKNDFDVTIFTTSFAGNFYQEFAKVGVPVEYKYLTGSSSTNKLSRILRLAKNFWRTLRYIRRHNPDIIHYFLPGSYLLGGYAATLLRRKHLIMSRRSQNDYQKKHHKIATVLEHRLHKRMSRVLANSQKVATQLKDEGVNDKQLRLIYNGVDLDRYSLNADPEFRESLDIPNDALVFTIVANLFFYKGHQDLLHAFANIHSQLPENWVLLCVGRNTGELDSLQKLATKLGLENHIRFLGQRMDIPEIVSASDIGILASHEEGFSNAILEFMACGKPMMVTRVGGNAEAVLDQQCGYVVAPKDSDQMADALLKLATDPQIRDTFGQAARERVSQEFSLTACVDKYKTLYQDVLQTRSLSETGKPVILFVINNIGFVYSHRLPIILGAAGAGYEVHVATCFDDNSELKHQDKINYHHIDFNRNSINPVTELKPIIQLIKLYRRIRPDMIHHMCKKSVLYGCLITRFMPKTPVANTVPGLGYLFISSSLKSKLITTVLRKGYKFGFKRKHLKTIFQNDDDRELFEKYRIVKPGQCVMIRGSGVDIDEFQPTPHQVNKPLVIIPSRLLWDKGVGEFVEAARNLKDSGARFALVGDVDPLNPASISADTVKSWVDKGIVEHWGWCDDMVAVLKQADIVCLPSYREGMPKALLEAAACGLPIVTTDAPGCKDVIVHEESGFIVPIKDSEFLTKYLHQLIVSAELRDIMGTKARQRVMENFSTEIIVNHSLEIYNKLLSFGGGEVDVEGAQ
jgi:glycosyltransferase involved in cell wall biosynthesis